MKNLWSETVNLVESNKLVRHHDLDETKILRACPTCGWWRAEIDHRFDVTSHSRGVLAGAAAVLKALDVSLADAAVDEVSNYLLADYERRKIVDPQVFEHVVASVFRSDGFDVVVTGKSGDGGIDIILQKADQQVGVQVKRYRNSIKVDKIRELAGSLMIAGMTKGVFVTTSDFQSGCATVAADATSRGYQIELVNADQFYDALKLSRRNSSEDWRHLDIRRCFKNVQRVEEYSWRGWD